MEQLGLIDSEDKNNFGNCRIPSADSCGSNNRIIRRYYYTALTRLMADLHVEAILDCGNAAQMKKIAGQFLITELVLQ